MTDITALREAALRAQVCGSTDEDETLYKAKFALCRAVFDVINFAVETNKDTLTAPEIVHCLTLVLGISIWGNTVNREAALVAIGRAAHELLEIQLER